MHPKRDVKNRQGDQPLPNRAVEEFFFKLNGGLRHPKPSEQEVAQAIEAIHSVTQQATLKESGPEDEPARAGACPNCGATNLRRNRFCGYCGMRLEAADPAAAPPAPGSAAEQHVDHYHHFPQTAQSALRAPSSLWTNEKNRQSDDPGLDAEQAIPRLVADWSRFFNAQRLEELVGLYSADAIVLRSRIAYVHGIAAIRQLFQTAFAAGGDEFELECGDLGVAGEVACLAGHIRSLAPSSSGKRRESTGKYLLVLRSEAGTWKIVADAWCMEELGEATPAPGENAMILPMRSSLR